MCKMHSADMLDLKGITQNITSHGLMRWSFEKH